MEGAGGPTTSISTAGVPLAGRSYPNIETLLRELGLEVYIETFAKEHVDIDTVRSLPRLEVEVLARFLLLSLNAS